MMNLPNLYYMSSDGTNEDGRTLLGGEFLPGLRFSLVHREDGSVALPMIHVDGVPGFRSVHLGYDWWSC